MITAPPHPALPTEPATPAGAPAEPAQATGASGGRPKLAAVIGARFTHDEKAAICAAVGDAGMSLSAYARRRLLGHVVSSAADRAVLRELRRVGGLLKLVHIESQGAYSADTKEAITAVQKCIDRIAVR